MTVNELYLKVLDKISAKEGNLRVERFIKDNINYAYQLLSIKMDKTSKMITIDHTKKVTVLPKDFKSFMFLLEGTRELNDSEFSIIGDSLIVHTTDLKSDLSLYYVANPQQLTEGTQIDLSEIELYTILIYCSYAYYIQSNNIEVARLLYNEFNSYVQSNANSKEVALNEIFGTVQKRN